MEQLNSFIATLKTIYSQQGQAGRILIPAVGLFLFCCLCAFLLRLLPGAGATQENPPSPVLPTIAGTQPTPTALFGFGSTLFPTPVAPSAPATTPAPATPTLLPTPTVPSPTVTPIPTDTSTIQPPTVPASGSVQIIRVNKRAEYVEIQNTGNDPVDLTEWRLVSETGDQPCTLWLTILPNEVLRIWSRKGDGGFSCGYHINIWNDNQSDPAVLYDAQGKEMSRFP